MSRTILGIALSERSIAVAEVAGARGHGKLVRGGTLALPENAGALDPVAVGAMLRQFLREHRFSAGRCVVGLEGAWLVAREKLLPPCEGAALAGAAGLACEGEFPSADEDYALDFQAAGEPGGGVRALLVAASRSHLDRAGQIAKAAGLNVLAAGASALALAAAMAPAPSDGVVVLLGPDRTELVVVAGGAVRGLRRLEPLAAGGEALLAGEVRRLVALWPGGGASGGPATLWMWNDANLPAARQEALAGALSVPVQWGRLPEGLALSPAAPAPGEGASAAAAALAAQGLALPGRSVDFLHSRLAPPVPPRLRPWLRGAIAAAVVLGAAGAWLLLSISSAQGQVASLRQQRQDLADPAAAAKDLVERVTFARGWYDRRPQMLECLRQVTLAFPEQGRIWVTHVTCRDDRTVLLTGKSDDEKTILALLDRLKAHAAFGNVRQVYIRQASATTREAAFAISLQYVPTP